jgi:hypothetical protein
MADLNELFQHAGEESEGFAAEAARAQASVDQLLRLAAALTESVDAGSAEARRRLELLTTRLLEGEQDLLRENGAALGALAGLRTSSAEVQGRVGRYLTLVHGQLAELRAEKDHLRGELHKQGEVAQTHVARYSEHVREVEVASRLRLDAARQAVGSFRSMVETSRGALHERRETLLTAFRQMELAGRERIDYLVRAYDAVAATVQDQVAELQLGLRTLSDQAVAGLTRRLSDDAVESLQNAAEPLRNTITELERFCEDSRRDSGERLQEISRQIEDVTGVLERLRQPLEYIRQHLHH